MAHFSLHCMRQLCVYELILSVSLHFLTQQALTSTPYIKQQNMDKTFSHLQPHQFPVIDQKDSFPDDNNQKESYSLS